MSEQLFSTEFPLRLATRNARQLYIQLKRKIKQRLLSEESASLFKQFSLTTSKDIIFSRHKWLTQGLSLFTPERQALFEQYLLSALSLQSTLDHKISSVVLACDDEDTYRRVKEAVGSFVYVYFIGRERDLVDIQHYEQIRLITDSYALEKLSEQFENIVCFSSSTSIDEIFPEQYMYILEQQQDAVLSLLELSSFLSFSLPSVSFFSSSHSFTFQDMQDLIDQHAQDLQDCIHALLEKEQFTGKKMFEIVQGRSSILEGLSDDARKTVLDKRQELALLRKKEWGVASEQLLVIESTGEVSYDDVDLKKLFGLVCQYREENKRVSRMEQVSQAKQFLELLENAKQELLTLDILQACLSFQEEYSLSFPTVIPRGIRFSYGKNIFLDGEAVPVEYYVGEEEPIAMLTGANSGGKTTLLELVGQVQLLTHLGLGVPAKEAHVSLVEELYYFSKSKGTLGAGAFETMLKQFAQLTSSSSKKLILADEIESVTEPDVAALIIGGIIKQLASQKDTVTVFVSHIGRLLQDKDLPVRFDGIEAKGLNDQLELVVDRNPVVGRIARSTPQLIIERLAKKKQDFFYTTLLEEL